MDLRDRVVVITGGGTGVGAAIAARFAAAGAQVVVVGRREEPLRRTAESVSDGPPVRFQVADVTDRAQVAQLVASVTDTFGQIDILVNNAGVNIPRRKLAELEPAAWDELLAVNATGAFNMIHAVLPEMRARRDGLIVNISSISGVRPSALAGAAYTAAKHALSALSKTVNLEESQNGIRSTMIAPGDIDTPLLDRRPSPVTAETRARILQPDDIAAAVLFVAGLPARACVPELLITPTIYPFA